MAKGGEMDREERKAEGTRGLNFVFIFVSYDGVEEDITRVGYDLYVTLPCDSLHPITTAYYTRK